MICAGARLHWRRDAELAQPGKSDLYISMKVTTSCGLCGYQKALLMVNSLRSKACKRMKAMKV